MALKRLLDGLEIVEKKGSLDCQIKGITADSREVKKGYLFVAYQGVNADGHQFIGQAVNKGARAVVGEKGLAADQDKVTLIQVKDGRRALAKIAANWFGKPAKKLTLIGITGTNGKTSTAKMLQKILGAAYIGTIGYNFKHLNFKARETTPDPIKLHYVLKQFVQTGAKYAVIEATSQGLDQQRLFGLNFDIGIFTNLTQDHLDYHKTFKNYLSAKQILFDQSKMALLNRDDPYSKKIKHQNVVWYGPTDIKLKMLGKFNQYNAGAALKAAEILDVPPQEAQEKIKKVVVPGRLEPVEAGQDFPVLVDYAHTPDALKRILKNLRQITSGKLICVFGCGGDRDKTKRPKMGKIATNLSDLTIVTSDNPRTEDPEKIIQDIKEGLKAKSNYQIIANRSQAIKAALEKAKKEDTVIIAGKGHENYQILGQEKIHFDDRQEVRKHLKKI